MKRGKSKTSLKNSKNVKIVIGIFALVLISAVFVYADSILNGKAYQINPGQSQIINNWSVCQNVTNRGVLPIFVPVATASEWLAFRTNPPSYVNLSACLCAPDCVGRECGPNGCGGNCGTCLAGYTCDPFGSCIEEPSEPIDPDLPSYCYSDSDCDLGCRYISHDLGATCIYDCTTYVCISGKCAVHYYDKEEVDPCLCGCPGSEICADKSIRCTCDLCRPPLGCIVDEYCTSPGENYFNCPADCF